VYTDREQTQIYMAGSEEQILELLLPHECNHLLLHWRFYGKKMPIGMREGVAMLFESETMGKTPRIKGAFEARRQRPTLGLVSLLAVRMEPQPFTERSFRIYSSSYWYMRYLKHRGGLRGVGYFLEKSIEENRWRRILLDIERTNDMELVHDRVTDYFDDACIDVTTSG
jgi:hypothetical protein